MVDIVWQRMMTLVMKFCPLSLLSARDEAQTSNIKKYSNYLELRYLIWLQVTVSSDQAKKEKSQDDTSGRPRFQKKSCALEELILKIEARFFRGQAVQIKRRDYHALNSISVQGRRILLCWFEIFGQVNLIPSEKYKRSSKTRRPEKRRNLPFANGSSHNSESDISFFQFKGAKNGWVMLDILSRLSYYPKYCFPTPGLPIS